MVRSDIDVIRNRVFPIILDASTKACLIATAATIVVHKTYPGECCAPTMTRAARESRITTPIHRITAAES